MPKSDSAPPGTIWAQLQPNQPHRKPVPAVAGTHSAHECTSAPGKWTVLTGLCLGYLRGRSLPPPQKKHPSSPPKKELSLQYKSNYIGKIIPTRRRQCTYCNISQNAPDCISAHIHFKKLPGGMSPDPPRKLVAFGHSGLLPQTINPRQSPDWP